MKNIKVQKTVGSQGNKKILDELMREGLNILRVPIRDCLSLANLRSRYILWREEIKDFIDKIQLDNRIAQLFYRKDKISETTHRGIGTDIEDDFCQNLVKAIEIETNKKLDFLSHISDNNLNIKVRLENQIVEFNDGKVCIKIGEKIISLPPYKNEHYLCRAMNEYAKNEPVDWSIIYEKITGSEPISKQKNKRMVYDASEAVNNRIKEALNTDDDLFTFSEQTIKRNY